ncbi:membrane protein insertase YidC 2 [Cohnella abietis]|uniref:Membrane protein insertase YidC 2 n=1 Tax=Cohnella abietis TaxID=2507935 RepID=A0A3T1DFD1_9BACL|nr:YidC/Oxa1 family membrane protein insertase [Cohnella abietis]BBI36802.1 membrane protein insertase YidC 2 [Cohnella abietis]
MLRNRKWWIVISGLTLLMFLTGCTAATEAITTDQMSGSGSWWTRNVVYWFSLMLDKFAEWFGGEYGLSILLLTIIVRTIILPLMIKQYKNTKAMQALQPEMKKVREKYKDDPKKQQEEMMKLYQTNQVNPLAGCLPLIVQMPIFIALYTSINKNIEIREHTFIGFELGLSPNNSGHWYYYLIPLAAAITTLIQSVMMSKQQTMVGPMKGLMYIFPVMIFVMAINFPVALPLYWIYSNIYTIIQNYFMYSRSPKPAVVDDAVAPKQNQKSKKSGKGKEARGK